MSALASLKHLGRMADVASVLVRNGFADLVQRLELGGGDSGASGVEGQKLSRRYSVWARLRMVAEDLGPTFVKLGQLMSQRPDLLPRELVLELRKLQDQVSPEPFKEIEAAVQRALGKPLSEVFSSFEAEPIASASLAQVHRARLAGDGRALAVKVRRPGVVRVIKADLELLAALAGQLHQHLEALRPYNLPGLVKEISGHLQKELDFALEARHMVTARGLWDQDGEIDIPEPVLELTTESVLTMELIEGRRIEEAELTDSERKRLGRRLARTVLDMVLRHGFFHADPHPGNILVFRNSRGEPGLALVDWGLVGRLTQSMRFLVGDFLAALVDRDCDEMVRVLTEMGAAPSGADLPGLTSDVEQLLDLVHSRPLKDIDTGQVILEVMEIMRRHRLMAQTQYALLDKALLEMEGLARELDPDFDPVEVARPYVRSLWLERWRPDVLLGLMRRNITDTVNLLRYLPRRVDSILAKLERGELGVEFKHQGLVPLTRAIESSSNRIAVGLILAALIVGSSMIITTGVEPKIFGLPALGLVGYLISGVGGLWLVWSILRSRRGRP